MKFHVIGNSPCQYLAEARGTSASSWQKLVFVTYSNIYIYVCVCMYACMHVCMYVYIFIYIYVCMYVYIFIYIYIL